MQIAILGRQAEISLAELESLFGATNVAPIANYAALVDSDTFLPQPRLGGTMKSAKLLTKLERTDLSGAFIYLQETIPEHLHYLPEGKLQLGVSVYGFPAKKDWLLKQTLSLKKIIKKAGRSVRIIENKKPELESAQVLYNKLTGPLGWELLLIKDGEDIVVAQTTAVQNIDDYAKRDFDRPKRDAYVGMLPPKLAQVMINLAVSDTNPQQDSAVLDPFCGTGVVLQEALLMGYNTYGTDLSEKMINYSKENIQWLKEKYITEVDGRSDRILDQTQDDSQRWIIEQADATTYQWNFTKIQDEKTKISVACETYLGKPLSSLPENKVLAPITKEANQIAEGFLRNIAPQLSKGTRLCVALPAWCLGRDEFLHLEVLDHLEDLGYNRLEFVHAKKSDLIYHRTDQIVARELTILEKR